MTELPKTTKHIQALHDAGPIVHVLNRPAAMQEYKSFLEAHRQEWAYELREAKPTPAELLIEFAGRVCYMSFSKPAPKSNAQYIAHLIRQGHESVLEHAVWTIVLSGVSRAFTHQLVRHRPGFSYSQLSQQYHDEGDASFVVPDGVRTSQDAKKIWSDAMQASLNSYRELISLLGRTSGEPPASTINEREQRRALRSAARSVLPNATATVVVVTANARALRHFLSVRGAIEGDREMREVSAALLRRIEPDAPSVFCDYSIEILEDGSPIVLHHPNRLP